MTNENTDLIDLEYREETEVKGEKKMTQAQIINQKIKELKKLAKIDRDIATLKAKISKLQEEKKELEIKYGL